MLPSEQHTFVVCAYKSSPYLCECLESLMAQTVRTNVLVSTSTPAQDVRRICADFGVQLIEHDGESGLANDWNYAMSLAHTPFVTIAHQDDVYKPLYAERMLACLSDVRDPLIFFSDYGELRNGVEVDANRNLEIKRHLLKPIEQRSSSNDRIIKRRIIRLGSSICCPSVTIVKDNVPLPLFRQGLSADLDWDAWERLTNVEGSFVYCPEILMLHRIHEASETSRLIGNSGRTSEDLTMLKRFWPAPVAHAINLFYRLAQKSNG